MNIRYLCITLFSCLLTLAALCGIPARACADGEADPVSAVAAVAPTRPADRFLSFARRFGVGLSESGSWEYGGKMTNRADADLYAPLGFSFRTRFFDRRPAPPDPLWRDGFSAWGFALYQRTTSSRVLYGQLADYGLAARTRNIWSHAVPYLESHSVSGADLKTTMTEKGGDELFCALSSPLWRIIRKGPRFPFNFAIKPDAAVFVEQITQDKTLLYEAGSDFYVGLSEKMVNKLRVEWVMTEKNIPERRQKTWFSEQPAREARKLRFNALNVTFTRPNFGLSSDFAWSEVFNYGEGFYINGAVRAGSAPWRFSFAADAATEKFMSNDGEADGSGLRLAGKFEWFAPGSKSHPLLTFLFAQGARLLVAASVRAAAADKPFTMSSGKCAYYFPLLKKYPVAPTRLAAEFERNAADPLCITDKTTLSAAARFGPARGTLRVTFAENSSSAPGQPIILVPNPFGDSSKDYTQTAFELSVPVSIVLLKGAVAWKSGGAVANTTTASVSASVQGKYGRLTFKISSAGKDKAPDYYLSWRLKR